MLRVIWCFSQHFSIFCESMEEVWIFCWCLDYLQLWFRRLLARFYKVGSGAKINVAHHSKSWYSSRATLKMGFKSFRCIIFFVRSSAFKIKYVHEICNKMSSTPTVPQEFHEWQKVPFLILEISWIFLTLVSTILLFWYRCTQDIILHARQEFSSPLSLEIGSSGRINLMPAWNWLSKQ